MQESARLYFDETQGWTALPGLRAVELDVLANPAAFAEARTGFEILSYSKPARTRTSFVRFNTFLLAHVRTGPIRASWARTRDAARQRYLFVLVNHGSVRVEGPDIVGQVTGGGVAVVAPGDGPIEIEAYTEAEGVIFTFDAAEVAPLDLPRPAQLQHVHSSPVFNVAYSYLKTAARVSGTHDPVSVGNLRSLTRAFAQALIQETTHSRKHGQVDIAQHALAIIDTNYHRSDFGIDAIAHELQTSRRTLERTASASSLRLGDEIRSRRTNHALALLQSQPLLTVDDVASRSGFRTASSMRRALRRVFDSNPSEIRSGNGENVRVQLDA